MPTQIVNGFRRASLPQLSRARPPIHVDEPNTPEGSPQPRIDLHPKEAPEEDHGDRDGREDSRRDEGADRVHDPDI